MNARVDPSDFDVGTPAAEGSPAAPAPAEEALKVPPKSEKLDDVETPAQHRRHRPRKRVIIPLVLATLASGAGWFGWHWWTQTRFIESTDDAYFKANIVALAPRVAGTVVSVKVGDNEKVKAGQVLLRIDDSTYRADERQAEANLAGAKAALTHLAARRALQRLKIEEAQANLNAAQSQLTLARANNARSQRLFKDGFTAKSKLDATRAALKAASAVHAKAAAALASARQQLKVLASEQQQLSARRDRAAAAARVAELNLAHTVVRAPRDGVVGNKGVRVGEYVHVGQTLMSLVPRNVYVVANFKETQVADFKPGMRADVDVDLLGGKVLHGRIASLAPASGAEFAILPPENATGNFTKVVQRIPVKILLDRDAAVAGALRAGTSVEVSVDTKGAEQ